MRMWDLDDLVTLPQAAANYGLSRSAANIWEIRYSDFPKPKLDIGGTKLFSWLEIVIWVDNRDWGKTTKPHHTTRIF